MNKEYLMTIKINNETTLFYTVNEYTNNGGRIRFLDTRTNRLKNYPEDWVAIDTIYKNQTKISDH